MRIDRKGCTRLVFIFKNIVIKVPNFTCQWNLFLRGLLANMQEDQTWRWNSGVNEGGNSHLLCPVIWCSWGGWILVMKKAEVFDMDAPHDIIDYQIWRTAGFGGDDKPCNYGMLEGRVVKIDYGS